MSDGLGSFGSLKALAVGPVSQSIGRIGSWRAGRGWLARMSGKLENVKALAVSTIRKSEGSEPGVLAKASSP